MKTIVFRQLVLTGLCLASCQATAIPANAGPVSFDEEQPIVAEPAQLGRPVEFERDVYPILEANCIACHNAATAENQLILENAAAIIKGGTAGPSVIPGKPDESLFIKVAARTEEPVMPPWPNDVQAKKLTPAELGILRQWVAEGALGGSAAKAVAMNWQPINDQLKAVYSVDVDQSGRFVAAGRGGKVTVYDLAVNTNIARLDDAAIHPAGGPAVAHRDYVHAIAFHPSGELLATSGFQEVKLWQRQTSAVSPPTTLPQGTTTWAVAGDGSLLAVAGTNPGMAVIRAADGASVVQTETDGQVVTALAALPGDVTRIVALLADGRVQVSAAAGGEVLSRSEPMPVPGTAVAVMAAGQKVAVHGTDGVVRLFGVAADSGVLTAAGEIKSEAGAITRIESDGAALATLVGQKVEVWKGEDGTRLAMVDLPAAVIDLSLNTTTDRLAAGLADGQVLLWAVKEPKQIAVLNQDLPAIRVLRKLETDKAIRDSRAAVLKSQVEESEKEVVAQKDAETKARAELEKAVAATGEAQKKFDEAAAAAVAAKTALDAKADDAALKQASEAADKAQTAAQEALNAASAAQQLAQKSVDFAAAAVTRAEGRVAERKTQHESAQQESVAATTAAEAAKPAAAAVIPSAFCRLVAAGQLVAASDAAGTIRLWKAVDGVAVDVFPASPDFGGITSIRAVDSSLWMTDSQNRLVSRSVLPGWSLRATLGTSSDTAPSVFVDRVLSLAFSPDGTLLAAGGGEASRSGQVTLWNVQDQTLVRELKDAHSDTVYGLEFSPDGKLLATASADKFAKVFDVSTGNHVQSYEGHTHHVMDIAWKADRTVLASAGADNAIKVWNAETGEQARTIATYTKQVTSLQFVGLQDNMLSSSGDKRVFLHAASSGGAVREFGGSPDYVYRAAVTPDGSIVAAGCEDGVLRIWNGADGKEIVKFAAE
jgi:WD40 repeat protein